jgi:hypothetical protein
MHNMTDTTIENLTDEQLNIDVPNVGYFKNVVEALYEKGIKVGVASFGVDDFFFHSLTFFN